MTVDFFHTHVSPESLELVNQVLASGYLSEGLRVKEFEAGLTSQLGLSHPVCVNSGTSALHLALAVAGVKPGDEVILPAQTFVATGLAVLMQGATPVFADINLATGNICPYSIAEKVTDRTKAIMPVHWAGYPCDMDEITGIARKFNLSVVEDAAHALGAQYRGKQIGAISRFTAFSFQAIKHLTTGDGGALCCMDTVDESRAREQRWFGIDRVNSRPSILGERVFDITEVGYKYHMNEIAAAVGIGNLRDFPARLFRRQEIAARYRRELCDVPGLQLLDSSSDRTNAYWLFTILVDRREDFIRKLRDCDIPASVVHLRIDRYSVFGGIRADLPNQTVFDGRQVSIPTHEGLTEKDVEHVVKSIRGGW